MKETARLTRKFCLRYVAAFWGVMGCGFLLLIAPDVLATMTITPANGGSLGTGSHFYYFVKTATVTGPTAPAFATFTVLDVTKGTSIVPPETALENAFQLNVVSDKATGATGSQQAVVTVNAIGGGTGNFSVSIASVNGVACNPNICQAFNQVAGTNRYFAAKYFSQQTLKIGFYPTDVCADYFLQGGSAVGCNSGVLTPPIAGTPQANQLKFFVKLAADGNQNTVPGATEVDSTPNPLALTYQVDSPSFTCPDQTTLNNMVTPGDGQIQLNASYLGMTTGAGLAPAVQYLVIGQDRAVALTAPLDFTATYRTGNNFVSGPGSFGNPNQTITGFTNSTQNGRHSYDISFLAQDATGVLIPPTSTSACVITPVETAVINGFLQKSSCFIATAAFDSAEAEPVAMLRDFRDRVLLKTASGRGFVSWYYAWSPKAAEWLVAHPVFRLPVLLFLAPVEMIAWIVLHPVWFFLFFSVSILTTLGVIRFFGNGEGEPSEM